MDVGYLVLKESAVITKDQHGITEIKFCEKYFLRVSTQNLVVQWGQKLHLNLKTEHGSI